MLHCAIKLRDVVFLVLKVLLGLQQFGLQLPRLLLDLRGQVLLRIQNLLVELINRLMQFPDLLSIFFNVCRVPPHVLLQQFQV